MIGFNNIDSVMSAILTEAKINTSAITAESFFAQGMDIRVAYHGSLMLSIGGMLFISLMYLYEILKE